MSMPAVSRSTIGFGVPDGTMTRIHAAFRDWPRAPYGAVSTSARTSGSTGLTR